YGLSDDAASPFKWIFRDAAVGPGRFLLVFASGKDRQPGVIAPTNPATVAGLKAWLRADAVATSDATEVRTAGANFFVRRWLGPGFAIISVNYSNKQPFLYWQGNLACAGVPSPRVTVTAPTQIGSGAYGAFAGDVAEILVYDRALSESERRSIEESLARQYALP